MFAVDGDGDGSDIIATIDIPFSTGIPMKVEGL